jgi:sugar/nucleoside kinase (ribokinase family)
MNVRRIAVVGTVNRDIIITRTGARTESLGGILYNTLSLAELGNRKFEIFPVTYIASDVKTALLEMIAERKAISPEGISMLPGATNMNLLRYVNENERKETTEFHTPSIPLAMIVPFFHCDVLLFNFISGYDVTLDTLKSVRRKTNALIFVDVHSMVLKKAAHGERTFVSVEDWRMWARQADIIQMNAKELVYFTGHESRTSQPDQGIVRALMRQIMSSGPRFVLVTAGARGVFLGAYNAIHFFRQKYAAPVKDTTGCGDIFTASFIAKLLVTKDVFVSCEYANVLAGLATREPGIKKCFALKHSSPLC